MKELPDWRDFVVLSPTRLTSSLVEGRQPVGGVHLALVEAARLGQLGAPDDGCTANATLVQRPLLLVSKTHKNTVILGAAERVANPPGTQSFTQLTPLSGQLEAWLLWMPAVSPPLSAMKTMMVLLSMPRCCSARTTRPTDRSISRITPAAGESTLRETFRFSRTPCSAVSPLTRELAAGAVLDVAVPPVVVRHVGHLELGAVEAGVRRQVRQLQVQRALRRVVVADDVLRALREQVRGVAALVVARRLLVPVQVVAEAPLRKSGQAPVSGSALCSTN